MSNEIRELAAYADVLGKSGYFPIRHEAEGIALFLVGKSLGLSPVESLQNLHVIEGRPVLSANAYASFIRKHPDYDYEVVEQSREACAVRFHGKVRGEWRELGVYRITLEEAKSSGLAMGKSGMKKNWKVHPDAMLFARAVSQGCRIHCPDVFSFSVYTDADGLGEHEAPIEVEAEVVSTTTVDQEPSGPPRRQAGERAPDPEPEPEPEPAAMDAEWAEALS